MDDFKGIVKIDFKEAREKSGVSKAMAQEIFNEVGYTGISLDAIENNEVKLNEQQVNTLFSMYDIPSEYRKGYYEKYTERF